MLTSDELAAMRTTAGSALPDSCVIQSQSWVSDGGGGGTTTWTASGTVDCRLAPVTGQGAQEVEEGERITPDAEFIFTLPYDTTITTDSRIVHTAGTFNVEAIRDRSYETSKRVEVKKQS